jgi:hypothetical protein
MGLKMKPMTTLVKNWVISEATAAPTPPQSGIRNQFRMRLAAAPMTLIPNRYFCYPSARIQTFRTDP